MFEIPTATRPPQTTTSADGTTIAYDLHGDASTGAPVVVCVGGATNTRLEWSSFCDALADRGLVGVTYDRRGRGDSSDTTPYAVASEVEDLTAVVEAVRAGGRAVALGFSSGAALVLRAAAAGAPLERAVIMEPPYRIEGSPPLPDAYCDTLEAMIAEGRNDDAFEYFQVRAVGLPQEMVDGMKGTEMWAYFARTAPTLSYDGHCLGGNVQAFPTELVVGIEAPILALASTGSPPFLQGPARMVGETAPNARFELLEGEFHTVPDDVLADAVAGFAREG